MCGISGIVLHSGQRPEQSLLVSMGDALYNRGPDAGGYYSKLNVGLSHRRLKIIDLSDDANQPMLNDTQSIALVYNGEIYNFKELRIELESLGFGFKTQSDTEVVLKSFEAWGSRCFLRFNGIFAMAIVDYRQREPIVWLVRDRFGAKPLFYAQSSGRMAFASTLKPLLQLPWIDRTIESDTILKFLKFSHFPGPLTVFRGVRQLGPGEFLRFKGGENSEPVRYWDVLDLASSVEESRLPYVVGKAPRAVNEWTEELDGILKRAIKRQIISDVPVGCFLSGGIDSSLLTLAYKSVSNSKISTFTIGYKEAEFDERTFAQEVATKLQTDHHDIPVEPSDLFDLIPKIPEFYDMPLGDPTVLPTLHLMKYAKNHVTVGLAGDGGDELFFGYNYEQALYHMAPLLHVPDILRKNIFSLISEATGRIGSSLKLRQLQQVTKLSDILQFDDEADFFQSFVGTIGPLKITRLQRLLNHPIEEGYSFFDSWYQQIKHLPIHERIAQTFLRTFLVDTVLAKTDRAGMAFGLEARVPFLDNEVADFSARLPFNMKYRHGVKKYILRHLLSKSLPENISARPKQGFSVPMRLWLKTKLKFLLDEQLGETRLKQDGIFNVAEIKMLIHEHLNDQANHSHLLWSLICFQMWKEAYRQ